MRPASVIVQLYSNQDSFAAPMSGKDIVLSASNGWHGTWTGLDDQYTYRVQEVTVGGYSVSYSPADRTYPTSEGKTTDGGTVTITNTRTTPPAGTIEVKKVWQDSAENLVTVGLPEQVQFELNRTETSGSTQSTESLRLH